MKEMYHKDPSVLNVNRQPVRSYCVPVGNIDRFSPLKRERSDRFLGLGGQWSFRSFSCPEDIPEGIFEPDYVISPLKKIEIPCCLDEDIPDPVYIENTAPFVFDPPYIPDNNTSMVFLRDFDGGKIIDQHRKYIVFEGVCGPFYLYINGNFAGYSCRTNTTAEFDISSLVTDGVNRVAVVVLKWGALDYITLTKGWNFFGISGDVYLLGRPNAHIRDFTLRCSIDQTYRDAYVKVTLDSICPETATATLYDPSGKKIETKEFDSTGEITLTVGYPSVWSCETPDRYLLVLEACGEYLCHPFGLRTVDFADGRFRLNGRKTSLKGVVFNPLDQRKGCCLSAADLQTQLFKIKSGNINAVISDGGLYDPRFLELCEKYGLYIINDLYPASFEGEITDELAKMRGEIISDRAKRDKNFACLVGSAIGNPSDVLPEAVLSLKNDDPTRPVFTPDSNDIGGDYVSKRALSAGEAEQYMELNPSKYLLLYNCCDVYGLSGGSFEKYKKLFDRQNFMGMFVRQWSCPSFIKKINGREITQRHGDCTDALVSSSGNTMSAFSELLEAYRPFDVVDTDIKNGDFAVVNLYDFTYLSRLELSYEITRYGKVISGGNIGALPVAPQNAHKIHIDLDLPDGEIYIRFVFKLMGDSSFAPDGYVVGQKQFLLQTADGSEKAQVSGELKLDRDDKTVTLSGDGFKYTLSKFTGTFVQMESEGKKLFKYPSSYNIWRIPPYTNSAAIKKWERYSFNNSRVKVYNVECAGLGSVATVSVSFSIGSAGTSPYMDCEAVYTVDADGTVSLNCAVSNKADVPFLPCFGLRFFLQKDLKCEYYGYGPGINYPDRMLSSYMEHFSSPAEELAEKYTPEIQNGNRRVKLAALYDRAKSGLMLFDRNGFDFSACAYSHEQYARIKKGASQNSNCTVITADYMQSGLGFDPVHLPESDALLSNKNFTFSLKFRPVSKNDSSVLKYLINDVE